MNVKFMDSKKKYFWKSVKHGMTTVNCYLIIILLNTNMTLMVSAKKTLETMLANSMQPNHVNITEYELASL